MLKRTARIIAILLVAGLLVSLASCDFFGLGKKYTIEATTYVDGLWVYMEYRESGSTEWIDADMVDEDGNSISFIVYGDSSYENTGFFDVPGLGTYDFRGVSILGGTLGVGEILDCEVVYDNMGLDSAHSVTISDLTSIHGFN